MDLLKLLRRRTVLTAIVYLAAGLVLVIFPQITAEVICITFGVLTAAVALMYLLSYFREIRRGSDFQADLVSACLWGVLSLFIFLRQDVLLSIIPVVLGFAVLFNGIMKLSVALQTRAPGTNGWIFCLVCALLELGVGLFFVLDPLKVAAGLITVFGIALLFAGITDLLALLLVRGAMKEAEEIHDITEEDITLLPPKD